MISKSKKGFTLIELIGLLVIMAMLALIVTPLVMNIIRKARVAVDKRSIDAYGRSIKLAIVSYLLENGEFPTSIDQLTIKYSGSEVDCETIQINPDSSVYLSGYKVAERSVGDYTYGVDKNPASTYIAYTVGNQVTYNGVVYYVIENSETAQSTVKLLKAEPLDENEIVKYSNGTGAATNEYGGMQYHSSSNVYSTSYVKATVESWAAVKVPAAIEVRLITVDEVANLGYEWKQTCATCGMGWVKTNDTPTWVYNNIGWWWTMSPGADSTSGVWNVDSDGSLGVEHLYYNGKGEVRPVIVIDKTVLSS